MGKINYSLEDIGFVLTGLYKVFTKKVAESNRKLARQTSKPGFFPPFMPFKATSFIRRSYRAQSILSRGKSP